MTPYAQRTPGLSWETREIPIQVKESFVPFVELTGRVTSKDFQLNSGKEGAVEVSGQEFKVILELIGPQTPLQIQVQLGDQKYEETLMVTTEVWSQLDALKASGETGRSHYLTLGLGMSELILNYPGAAVYTSRMVTAKLTYKYRLSRSFDVGVSGFVNAMNISQSSKISNSKLSGESPDLKFAGFNLRLGYRLIDVDTVSLLLFGGGYYLTAYTSTFSNIKSFAGPQLYPVFVKRVSRSKSFFTYAKLAPILSGVADSSISESREAAFGLGYTYGSGKGGALNFFFDASNLKLKLQDTTVQINVLSISAGYSF